jgi:hypothetical protein
LVGDVGEKGPVFMLFATSTPNLGLAAAVLPSKSGRCHQSSGGPDRPIRRLFNGQAQQERKKSGSHTSCQDNVLVGWFDCPIENTIKTFYSVAHRVLANIVTNLNVLNVSPLGQRASCILYSFALAIIHNGFPFWNSGSTLTQ